MNNLTQEQFEELLIEMNDLKNKIGEVKANTPLALIITAITILKRVDKSAEEINDFIAQTVVISDQFSMNTIN